jgi:four helix bundle protein
MEKKFLMLNDVNAYKIAFNLANYVWVIVLQWNYFAQDTIGKQFVKAVDSIAANIAEGFGRYTKKEKVQFYRYGYGSVTESLNWNEMSKQRKLLTAKQYEHIFSELKKLPREVHHLIDFTNKKLTI